MFWSEGVSLYLPPLICLELALICSECVFWYSVFDWLFNKLAHLYTATPIEILHAIVNPCGTWQAKIGITCRSILSCLYPQWLPKCDGWTTRVAIQHQKWPSHSVTSVPSRAQSINPRINKSVDLTSELLAPLQNYLRMGKIPWRTWSGFSARCMLA